MKKLILLASLACMLAACHNQQRTAAMATIGTRIDSLPGLCPYLTKDNQGNTVISWVRTVGDSAVFCYALSRDGKNFSKPFIIPSSTNIEPHSENLPKIIFKASGEAIALWGSANPNPRNKYSGLVFYAQSFDNGRTWSQPRSLVSDTAAYDQRYYDVALLPNGEAGIIWLDNRKVGTQTGSALYFASTQGRNGFGEGRRISQPCCPCCRTKLFVDSKGGIHALYRGILNDSIRDMVHIVSTDGGRHFSAPERISPDNWVLNACPHTGPSMTENKNGLQFAWFTGGANAGCFYTHVLGSGFAHRDNISHSGSHPQIAALDDGGLVIAWDESVRVDNQFHTRIGIQRRTADGRSMERNFITPETADAAYPVVSSIGITPLVAYTDKQGKDRYVTVQLLK